jgi:hypothetical protein
MRMIITDYVVDKEPVTEFPVLSFLAEELIDLRLEKCNGPKCQEEDANSSIAPACQALIEIENTFVSVPAAFQILWMVCIGLFLILVGKVRFSLARMGRQQRQLRFPKCEVVSTKI